jgi:putative acyl-CoA dehydrogenase
MPDLTLEVFNQPEPLFAAFCDSRLAGIWGHAFGTLGAGTDFDAIITRAMPR